jgi:hypothetical protein
MSIEKFAYLLDSENKIYENKIFIDLMWYIAKNKVNGAGKPKGMVTVDKNGKVVVSAKSYVIRNAGIMFQHLFDWHFYYIKRGESTLYQYNDKGTMVNVVYKNFEDWWNAIRLTEVEITSANKFLIEAGLISIHKMRIATKVDKDTPEERVVHKPTNCYAINWEATENYLDMLVEISKDIYKQKVEDVRSKNIESSLKSREKRQSAEIAITLETGVTLKTEASEGAQDNLSTESTLSTDAENAVTLETGVTKVTAETGVTKDTLESEVTNNTLSTYTLDSHSRQNREFPPLPVSDTWEGVKKLLLVSKDMTDVAIGSWINPLVPVEIKDGIISLKAEQQIHKQFAENKFKESIINALKELGLDGFEVTVA